MLLGIAQAVDAEPDILAVDLVEKAAEGLRVIGQGLGQVVLLIIKGNQGLALLVQATESVVGHADQIGIRIGWFGMTALDDMLEIVGIDGCDDVFRVADVARLEQDVMAQAPDRLMVELFELVDGLFLIHMGPL